MQSTYVFESNSIKKSKAELLSFDASLVQVQNMSMAWQLRSDKGTISAYSSGKIVVQSSDKKWAEKVNDLLCVSSADAKSSGDFFSHIGVDEAGKGDYFGPMVVGAVFINSAELNSQLVKFGVRDSKKLTDKRAVELRKDILGACKYTSEVVISPKRYNELYKDFRNVNKLLAWGHARAMENILEGLPNGVKCEQAVIDQFSKSESRVLDALMKNGKRLEITQMHGGESDIAVAAASIIARGRFLLELSKLGKKYKVEFPKGASNVIQFGKEFIKNYSIEELENVAKTSFKTSLKITSTFDI